MWADKLIVLVTATGLMAGATRAYTPSFLDLKSVVQSTAHVIQTPVSFGSSAVSTAVRRPNQTYQMRPTYPAMDMYYALTVIDNDVAFAMGDVALGFTAAVLPPTRQPSVLCDSMTPYDIWPDSWCPGNQTIANFLIDGTRAQLATLKLGQAGLNASSTEAAAGLVAPDLLNLTALEASLQSASPTAANSLTLYMNATLECLGFTPGGKPETTLLAMTETLSRVWTDGLDAPLQYAAATGFGSFPAQMIAGGVGTCPGNGTACGSQVPCIVASPNASYADLAASIRTTAIGCPALRLCTTAQAYIQLDALGCTDFVAYFSVVGQPMPLWPNSMNCVLF